MSSLISRARVAKPMRRAGSRVVAGVAAIAMSGVAVTAIATPAQARPRSCWNIGQSMMFFELSMELDTGLSAQFLARDTRAYNYELRIYNAAGC